MAPIAAGIFCNAEHSFWYMYLKTGPVLVLTVLPDRDAGDGKNFLDQEKAKTGVSSEPFRKNPFFVRYGYADPVILKREDQTGRGFMGRYPDQGYAVSPVQDRILDKVVKNPFKEGV